MGRKDWQITNVGNLCSRIGDGLHGTPEYNKEGEIYFINGVNIKNGRIVVFEDTKKISIRTLEKHFIPLDEKTLLMSINGTLGNLAFYYGEKIMLGKSAAYLNFKTEINRFYYYYFQLSGVQEYFYQVATGSTIKNLGLKSIQDFEVPCPEEKEWRPIAKVLSDLDAKIELNKKINSELEAMAKLIYDFWFVQFDFPNEDGLPYKSSGGKMVWNEELKREVPEGWEVKELGKYANIKKGTLITGKTSNSIGKIKVVSAGLDFSYYHDVSNYPENTISISASGANAGYINFWREPIFACDCTTVRGSNDADTIHILGFLKMRQEFIYQQARGSAQPHVYPKDIEALLIPTPPFELITKFSNKVISGNKKISINLKENQKLAELRDWLLPMLMNGQVKFK